MSKFAASPLRNTQVEKLLYSADDAAFMLSLSRKSIYHLMTTGRLPYQNVGCRKLIRRDDLLAFSSKSHPAAIVPIH